MRAVQSAHGDDAPRALGEVNAKRCPRRRIQIDYFFEGSLRMVIERNGALMESASMQGVTESEPLDVQMMAKPLDPVLCETLPRFVHEWDPTLDPVPANLL
jgi:hypothetical protein